MKPTSKATLTPGSSSVMTPRRAVVIDGRTKWEKVGDRGLLNGPRTYSAGVGIPGQHRALAFGGGQPAFDSKTDDVVMNDIHEYNQDTHCWRPLSIKTESPGKRKGHSLTYCPEHNWVILFGGVSSTAQGKKNVVNTVEGNRDFCYYNDVWVFDLDINGWLEITNQICDGPQPDPRAFHSAVQWGTKLVIFGGYGCHEDKNVWILNLTEKKWETLTLLNNSLRPDRRYGHSAAIYRNHIFLYGGQSKNRPCDPSVWRMDLENAEWHSVEIPAKAGAFIPIGRTFASSVILDHRWVIMGGTIWTPVKKQTTEVIEFNFKTEKWRQISPLHLPKEAEGMIAFTIPSEYTHSIVIAGGLSGEGVVLDTTYRLEILNNFNTYAKLEDIALPLPVREMLWDLMKNQGSPEDIEILKKKVKTLTKKTDVLENELSSVSEKLVQQKKTLQGVNNITTELQLELTTLRQKKEEALEQVQYHQIIADEARKALDERNEKFELMNIEHEGLKTIYQSIIEQLNASQKQNGFTKNQLEEEIERRIDIEKTVEEYKKKCTTFEEIIDQLQQQFEKQRSEFVAERELNQKKESELTCMIEREGAQGREQMAQIRLLREQLNVQQSENVAERERYEKMERELGEQGREQMAEIDLLRQQLNARSLELIAERDRYQMIEEEFSVTREELIELSERIQQQRIVASGENNELKVKVAKAEADLFTLTKVIEAVEQTLKGAESARDSCRISHSESESKMSKLTFQLEFKEHGLQQQVLGLISRVEQYRYKLNEVDVERETYKTAYESSESKLTEQSIIIKRQSQLVNELTEQINQRRQEIEEITSQLSSQLEERSAETESLQHEIYQLKKALNEHNMYGIEIRKDSDVWKLRCRQLELQLQCLKEHYGRQAMQALGNLDMVKAAVIGGLNEVNIKIVPDVKTQHNQETPKARMQHKEEKDLILSPEKDAEAPSQVSTIEQLHSTSVVIVPKCPDSSAKVGIED